MPPRDRKTAAPRRRVRPAAPPGEGPPPASPRAASSAPAAASKRKRPGAEEVRGPLRFMPLAKAEAPAPSLMGDDLTAALHADFAAFGRRAIVKLRNEKPADYLKIIAALSPRRPPSDPDDKDAEADPFARLSDAELIDALAAVRALAAAADPAGGGD